MDNVTIRFRLKDSEPLTPENLKEWCDYMNQDTYRRKVVELVDCNKVTIKGADWSWPEGRRNAYFSRLTGESIELELDGEFLTLRSSLTLEELFKALNCDVPQFWFPMSLSLTDVLFYEDSEVFEFTDVQGGIRKGNNDQFQFWARSRVRAWQHQLMGCHDGYEEEDPIF